LIRELCELWKEIDLTVEEGLTLRGTLCSLRIQFPNGNALHNVPKPRQEIAKRFAAADIDPPRILLGDFAVAESQKKK
jgi:hypothetical protein